MEDQEKLWNRIAPEWHEHKTIPSVLSKKFLEKTHGNVLDLGSGSGRHLTKIKDGTYFLQDFSIEMLKLAAKKAEKLKIPYKTIHSPLNKIPKKDNFFDFAISISALHCVPDEKTRKKAISEIYRVLKPKGEAYIGVWNANSKRFRRRTKNGQREHLIGWTNKGKRYYYLYTEEEIHKQFKEAGFIIKSTHNSEMMINFVVVKNN